MEGVGRLLKIKRCPRVLPTHNKTKEKIKSKISNCPNIARGKKKRYLPASYAGAQRIFTDTNLLINIGVCEVVPATGHGTNENGDIVCCG